MNSFNRVQTASTRRNLTPAGATRRAIAMAILGAAIIALGGCF
jgi:hypothetical protein